MGGVPTELSRVINQETFESLIHSSKGIKYNGFVHYTREYEEKGIPMFCLGKFKLKRRNENGEWVVLDSESYIYMIVLSINTGIMFGGDGYLSRNVLSFTPKKDRLKKLIKAISDKHGIAKVLEQIEDGTITDLGKFETVRNYLHDIHNMGINPVTLSFRMNVPKTELTNVADGTDTMKEQVLLGLVDVLNAYGSQTQDYQQNGRPITDEDFKQISQL